MQEYTIVVKAAAPPEEVIPLLEQAGYQLGEELDGEMAHTWEVTVFGPEPERNCLGAWLRDQDQLDAMGDG